MSQKSIYDQAIEAAEQHIAVEVSLTSHSLCIGGEPVVDGGRWQGDLGVTVVDEAHALEMVEELFAAYQASAPDTGSSCRSRWFYVRRADEMTDQELSMGCERSVARCRLEVTTLALILNGSLSKSGPQMQGKWFWQSKTHPRLVLLAEWMLEQTTT